MAPSTSAPPRTTEVPPTSSSATPTDGEVGWRKVAVSAGATLEVKVTRTGAWTPPYTEVALVLPPGDTRSFVGGAVAPITAA